MKTCLLLYLTVCFSTYLLANDFSNLYSRSTLQYWKSRFAENIQYNFDGDRDNSVMAQLTPSQKRLVSGVILRFPLWPEEPAGGDPLAYYSTSNSITIPIFSVLFLNDISIAYAWIERNNYDIRTITEYMAMLKYQKPENQYLDQFPAPLEALHIPQNALDDPWVDDVSQKILKSAIYWIMAHELGHIYYRHIDYGRNITMEQSQLHERQADQFATEVMRKLGIAPVGMVHFFMLAVHWTPSRADFRDEAAFQRFLQYEASHPYSANRLYKIAEDLKTHPEDFTKHERNRTEALNRVYSLANDIGAIANILNDFDIQRTILFRALATDLSSLRPRKKGAFIPQDKGPSGNNLLSFNGTYNGHYMHYLSNGKSEWLSMQATLRRNGNQVTGVFDFGLGQGSITGRIYNNKLNFNWNLSNSYGKGIMGISEEGKDLESTWGYEDSQNNGGLWRITRE